MITKGEVQRVLDFMKDLDAVCHRHNVKLFKASGSAFQVGEIPAWAPDGFCFEDGCVPLELGPVCDSFVCLYTHENTSKSTGNVFNSAGVDNPLPPERE